MTESSVSIHDDDAGILCDCKYCQPQRCEDAPCCGCCAPGRTVF